jgi:hypothetical protein
VSKTFQFALAQILLALTHTHVFALTSHILLYGGNTPTETIVASCASDLPCERPRNNDQGEIVWTERLDVDVSLFGIFSSNRGLITSGYVTRDPDINNIGEVVWRFGDGGPGPNGIGSSVRGVVLLSSGIDPYYDTQRINNNGEIIAGRESGGARIWSSVRGDISVNSFIARNTEVNDSGEVVFEGRTNLVVPAIHSTERGAITTDSVRGLFPDINNHGEIVWQQTAFPPTASAPWEIWSNVRGKIGDGEAPSINDAGEVVWSGWDGADYEIYSSIRGQITSNTHFDSMPHINNLGEIVWLRFVIPEPASAVSAVIGATIWLTQLRRRPTVA